MSKACSQEDCHAPETSCCRGEVDFLDCSAWRASQDAESASDQGPAVEAQAGGFRFPWTGNAMGAADLPYLTGAASTRVVAIAGPAEAGKTSLLAAFYLLLGRGVRLANCDFAGSLTLEGWENIAGCLRWSTQGPSFPSHTSSGSGRRPGLLHLSMKGKEATDELLFADAPGEWFSVWASSESSQAAAGARWLSSRADVFVVTADSQALAGEKRGQARVALIDLLRRVGTERAHRPVALVWTKSDHQVPDGIRSSVLDAAKRSLGEFSEFSVSLKSPGAGAGHGQGFGDLFSWLQSSRPSARPVHTEQDPERSLLQTFGRI